MNKNLKMITESNYEVQLNEGEDKKLYIEGTFAEAEKKNNNGRIYKRDTLKREIDKFYNNKVKNRQALGEIGHPTDRSEVDLTKAAILIEDLKWQDNDTVWGKAKVLEGTPYGETLKGLLNSGTSLGISTRGLGETMYEKAYDAEVVKDSFSLLTWDVVGEPSANAWVNGILEGKTFPVPSEEDDSQIVQPTDEEIKMALKEHEKKIWQVLENIKKSL